MTPENWSKVVRCIRSRLDKTVPPMSQEWIDELISVVDPIDQAGLDAEVAAIDEQAKDAALAEADATIAKFRKPQAR